MAKSSILKGDLKNKTNGNEVEHYKIAPGKQEILQAKKKIIKVVESLLEENISADMLIRACHSLSKSDYSDVIEERSILHLCGYPLCSNYNKPSSQKFRIVCKMNRVYDITERKCFCSNKCYKASSHLKEQLSEIPVWFQEKSVSVKLLADEDNRGSLGDCVPLEVVTNDRKTEIYNSKNGNTDWFTDCDKKLVSDEVVNSITGRITNLEIKERSSCIEGDNEETLSSQISPSRSKQELSLINSDPDDVDEEEDHDQDDLINEEKQLYEKLMPIPAKSKLKPSILVEPHSNVLRKSPLSGPISLRSIQTLLKEWVTETTLTFLCNKKNLDEQKLDEFHKDMCDKANSFNTCDESILLDDAGNASKSCSNNDGNDIYLSNDNEQTSVDLNIERVKLFFQGEDLRTDNRKQKKNVKFKTGKQKNIKIVQNKVLKMEEKDYSSFQDLNTETVKKSDPTSIEKLVLPNVDSLSQSSLRQQVVCSQLRTSFLAVLPFIGVHYRVLGFLIPELISSFSLTASNVVFKPQEWKLIAIVILRMIARSQLKSKIPDCLVEDKAFCTLLMKTGFSKDFSLQEIDQILQHFL